MLKHFPLLLFSCFLGIALTAILFSSCNKNNSTAPVSTDKWQKLNIPYSNEIISIHFTSRDTGYAVGSYSSDTKTNIVKTPYLVTYDGGSTWRLDTLHINNFVAWGIFNYGSTLYLTGNRTNPALSNPRTLYRSIDHAKTWQLMDTASFVSYPQFWSASRVLSTYSTTIFASSDSGRHFSKTLQLSIGGFTTPQLVDNQTAYVIGYGKMYKTTDSGVSWNPIAPFNYVYTILGLHFINPTTAYAFYDEGLDGIAGNVVPHNIKLIKTTDGALTWTSVNDHILADYGYCAYSWFLAENIGYMASNNMIFSTADGGKTWQKEYDGSATLLSNQDISGIYFTPAGTGLAFGRVGIYMKVK